VHVHGAPSASLYAEFELADGTPRSAISTSFCGPTVVPVAPLSIDRLPTNKLIITQELIAAMLGVRREGSTQAAGSCRTPALSNIREEKWRCWKTGAETLLLRVLSGGQKENGPERTGVEPATPGLEARVGNQRMLLVYRI
jgi:hypothetical protein